MKKVLVTGADGFIGSHLTESLLERGYDVKAFVYYNSFNTWGWLDTLPKEKLDQIEIFAGDVRDPNGVREAMRGVDGVFHLAALIAIPFSYHSPDSYVDTNIKGTLNVLQAARELQTERVMVTSTSEVYGTAQYVPIDEKHPFQGQSPYSATKIGADRLAESFWPGPLTMILPRKPIVPLRTTGGLETVGVRCPDHPVTLAVIREAGVPIAAPSGNTSGRPSPTCMEDMREDMDGKIDAIFDGGPCRVGVESTIIDLTCQPARLLRPGGLPLESLRDALGEVTVDRAVTQKMNDGEKPRAPGMKYRHYAPKAPVTVVTGGAKASARYLLTHAGEKSGIICFDEFARLFDGHIVHPLGASDDKRAQAQHVFDALRTFDETNVGEIWAQCPDSKGLGLAIGNRLKKAAGFHVEDADNGKIVIGITGGTGAGKTSLLRALERKGACVLDCDAVYHEMLKDDEPLLRALREAFGDVIFRQDGSVDVHAIGLIVFKDRKKLAELDAIVHERIPRALAQKMAATNAEIIGLDAIKLIESGLGAICDATVAVTAPEEVRVKRIMARDSITEEYARSRIAAQKDADYFRAQCDYEFVNDLPTAEKAEHAAEVYINTIINNLKEETER